MTGRFSRCLLISSLILFSSFWCRAGGILSEPILNPDSDPHFSDYYTVTEQTEILNIKPKWDPVSVIADSNGDWQTFAREAREALNLLSWVHHSSPLPLPSESYNRKKHFGTWIVDHQSGECYNTRARILIRDSSKQVQFSENNKCIVQTGEWHDPYTGLTYTSAHDIQIDHFVPLKNAYINGAWTWNNEKRCLYANYGYNNINLLAVSGHENQSKSDSTPADYMPPNPQFRCEYLQRWLKVKLAWGMTMTPPEAQAMKKLVSENQCDENLFQLSPRDLQDERQRMQSHLDLCRSL